MSEVRINLNESVKVRLTDLGKDVFYHQYDELNRSCGTTICKPRFPKEDAEGYTKFQLWDFIQLYGNHIGMARPNVIEPLEFICETEDFEQVRHAHWVKRVEEHEGIGYVAYTPVWSCSDCGKDYDPATCSTIKYCFVCGAKMDGWNEPKEEK